METYQIKFKYSLDDKLAYWDYVNSQSQFYLESEKKAIRSRTRWSLFYYTSLGILIAIIAYLLNSLFVCCMAITMAYFAFSALKKPDPTEKKKKANQFHKKYYSSLEHYVPEYNVQLGIADSGIRRKDGVCEELFYFSSITGIAETPEHIFVNVLGPQAFVIPVRKISEGDLEAFLSELKAKTDKARFGISNIPG